MAGYPPEVRDQAVALYRQHGATHAAQQTGVSRRTILRWAKTAGAVTQANQEKTAEARAAAADRITRQWADYRSEEAIASGAAAARARRVLMNALQGEMVNGSNIRNLATAYGILIDKADQLADKASARIELWAESEVDRELRAAINELEEQLRG